MTDARADELQKQIKDRDLPKKISYWPTGPRESVESAWEFTRITQTVDYRVPAEFKGDPTDPNAFPVAPPPGGAWGGPLPPP